MSTRYSLERLEKCEAMRARHRPMPQRQRRSHRKRRGESIGRWYRLIHWHGDAFNTVRITFRRYHHEIGKRAGVHLLHHPAAMSLHRDLADAEFATDLFVQQAGDYQRHNLPFATSE